MELSISKSSCFGEILNFREKVTFIHHCWINSLNRGRNTFGSKYLKNNLINKNIYFIRY